MCTYVCVCACVCLIAVRSHVSIASLPQVKQYNPNPAALDALTNYLKDYTPKQAEKMQSCRPAGGAYQSNARFEEDTTHKVRAAGIS